MNVLVTGAAGFIGKKLVQNLLKSGYDVIGFDKKSEDINTELITGDIVFFDFDEILDDVDVVFHLAGLLGTTELFHRIIEAEKVNVVGTLNLLESMRRKDVDKIVFTSKPNMWKHNAYTISKENCERYLDMYREIYGFKAVITRPFNVYGPNEPLIEYRKAVPYFIVQALKNENLEIFGNGEQMMDPIYVTDTVEALKLCSKKLPKETVEIGTREVISINHLAQKIIDLCESQSEIIHTPMRKGELDSSMITSNGNVENLLEFKPGINLDEGLKMTIEWYNSHLNDFSKIYEFKKEDFSRAIEPKEQRIHGK